MFIMLITPDVKKSRFHKLHMTYELGGGDTKQSSIQAREALPQCTTPYPFTSHV